MNSVKMIHIIVRYNKTSKRMMNLFTKVTNQTLVNSRQPIFDDDEPDELWNKDPLVLIKNLEGCLKLSESYQEQYRVPKYRDLESKFIAIFQNYGVGFTHSGLGPVREGQGGAAAGVEHHFGCGEHHLVHKPPAGEEEE